MYTVEILPHAEKQLKKLTPDVRRKVAAAILTLEEDPRPNGCKKLKDRDGYRIRVGDYRIIYEVFDRQLLVSVIELGHRSDVYG